MLTQPCLTFVRLSIDSFQRLRHALLCVPAPCELLPRVSHTTSSSLICALDVFSRRRMLVHSSYRQGFSRSKLCMTPMLTIPFSILLTIPRSMSIPHQAIDKRPINPFTIQSVIGIIRGTAGLSQLSVRRLDALQDREYIYVAQCYCPNSNATFTIYV